MEQRHLPEPTEPVSDEEVRSLIERFGEKQAAPPGQPTVKDVAETLHIEPETVAKMLAEIRGAKDQDEIKERLDRLEQENAELRSRTHHLPDTSSLEFQTRQKIAMRIAITGAVMMAFFIMVSQGRMGGIGFIVLLLIGAMVVLGVLAAKKKRG